MDIKQKITSLYNLKTTCGSENDAFSYIKNLVSDCCDEIFADDIGNVYALKKGTAKGEKKTVVVSCAMDTSGFVVKYVDDKDKKILLHALGEPVSRSLVGKRATTQSGFSGTLATDVEENSEKIGKDDFYITTDKNIKKLSEIKLGEFVSVENPPEFTDENKLCLGDMGEKIFAVSLIDIAKNCSNFSYDLYFVFTAQHYLSSRGEKCAASRIRPDILISLSLCEETKNEIGTGVVVSLCDSGARCAPGLCQSLLEYAKNEGIACSKNVLSDKNKPSSIAPYAFEGTACAIIGAPVKKDENGNKICDIRDINGVSAAVCAYLIFSDQDN